MRHLILQHAFGPPNSGGPVRALERLMSRLPDQEFRCERLQQFEPAGGINVGLLRRFRNEISASSPDLVHVRGLGNEGFHGVLAARLAGVPRILLSIHGTVRDLEYPGNLLRRRIVRDLLEPATLKMATHIITVCEFAARREFLAPYLNKFSGVVPNGVELPVLAAGYRSTWRRELKVSDDDVVAVCVSRLTREKGYLLLADALNKMPPLNYPLKLLIAGDGPDREVIERALGNATRARTDMEYSLLGQKNEVENILMAADFFIIPSLHENLSNALLEAMSFELPAVASAVGGNVEVLSRGGGVLVPGGDSGALGQAISRYVNDKDSRRADGVLARKVVKESYTALHMAGRLSEVYRDILHQT